MSISVLSNVSAIVTTASVSSADQSAMAEPIGTAADDIVLLMLMFVPTGVTVTPSGFTQILTTSRSGTTFWLGWARRGASALTYSLSWSPASTYTEARMISVRGCVTSGSPVDVSAASATTSRSPGNIDGPAVTPNAANGVAIACGGAAWEAIGGWMAPSGYTVLQNLTAVPNPAIASAYKLLGAIATEDPGAFSGSSGSPSDVHEYTVILKEQAVATFAAPCPPRNPMMPLLVR